MGNICLNTGHICMTRIYTSVLFLCKVLPEENQFRNIIVFRSFPRPKTMFIHLIYIIFTQSLLTKTIEMKKLLLLAIVGLVCFSSCYKEKPTEFPTETLVNTKWKINNHVPVFWPAYICGVAAELVFNKDSTGYYYYPSKCVPTDVDTLRFNWKLSVDGKNLYYTMINGDPKGKATVGISDFRFDALELRSGTYQKRFLDGIYEPDTAK